jgi:lysophospholipase L1-like esterase
MSTSSTLTLTPLTQRQHQRQRQPLRIIAVGDSLIYGFGDPIGGGWVERLRRQWMAEDSPGHALYNLGIRGNGVAQVKDRLEQEFVRRGELRNRLPDLLILSVGVNDSPKVGRPEGRNLTDLALFQSQMASLLDEAQQLCQVVFVGMVPIDEARMPFLDCLYYSHAEQYRYKEATKRACLSRQIPYLDIFDLWMKREDNWREERLTSDGLHPNVRGYQTLLENVLNWEAFLQVV